MPKNGAALWIYVEKKTFKSPAKPKIPADRANSDAYVTRLPFSQFLIFLQL